MHRELDAFARERRALFYPKADLPVADEVLRAPAHADPSRHVPLVAGLCRDVYGAAPASVEPLGRPGTFHLPYRAALDDGRSVVVRLNALSDQLRDYPLYLDAWAADRLRDAGLPALRVDAIDLSRRRVPFDFEMLEEARGVPLTALDDDDERLRPLLAELGRFVARLHGVRTRGYGFFDVRPLVVGETHDRVAGLSPAWRTYVLRKLEPHVTRCVALGALDRDEARRVFAAFLALDGLLDGVEPSLLHGDLGGHNVFADGGAVTALIDWEDCLSGDPAFDMAFWATFHPERRHAAFLDGYRAMRPLPADFAARFWLYFLRVALAKTVLRHRLGLADRPDREPAARRIQLGLERVEALLAGTRPLAA